MARFPDRRSAGPSRAVPYIDGEPSAGRHARRLRAALKAEAKVRAWACGAGVTVGIWNDGHHWRFTKNGRTAEWWPSSAKLVFQGQWDAGVHVHDADQLLRQVRPYFGADAGATEEGGDG